MKDVPILFNGAMVWAILKGMKTQTRRVVNMVRGLGRVTEVQESDTPGYEHYFIMRDRRMLWNDLTPRDLAQRCPFGGVGDRLWVRETFAENKVIPVADRQPGGWIYRADLNEHGVSRYAAKWTPSIHMPRVASRINLEVLSVKVQRLQDISEEDCAAEGLSCLTKDGSLYKWGVADKDGLPGNDDQGWHWREWQRSPGAAYGKLWERINGPGSWAANPLVWAISFKVLRAEGS